MSDFTDDDVDIVRRWHAATYGVDAVEPGVTELARLVAFARLILWAELSSYAVADRDRNALRADRAERRAESLATRVRDLREREAFALERRAVVAQLLYDSIREHEALKMSLAEAEEKE
jgi:hypothetical protein